MQLRSLASALSTFVLIWMVLSSATASFDAPLANPLEAPRETLLQHLLRTSDQLIIPFDTLNISNLSPLLDHHICTLIYT